MVAITSGSLMPVEIFDRCGWFEEDLIIDRVDDEYCLRVRSMGYTIALCRGGVSASFGRVAQDALVPRISSGEGHSPQREALLTT